MIIQAERDITAFVQRGNYIYWELEIFYEAIKILLTLVIEYKQLKVQIYLSRFLQSISLWTMRC